MSYISIAVADNIHSNLQQFDSWITKTDEQKQHLLDRATDRIEMLNFAQDDAVSIRTEPRYTEDSDQLPENLKLSVALLAGWYGDKPLLRYDLEDDILSSALSPQIADLFMTVQNLIFPFLSDAAQSNVPDVSRPKLAKPAYNWE